MNEQQLAKEASRLLGNMSSMAGYHGTTTADVVDYMAEKYSMTVFCNGLLRNIVFTPITSKTFSFKTEAA
jgi:DeoR/GlpR family transcriptional regulator of sugar metabolism